MKVTMDKHWIVWDNSSTHQWHPFPLIGELDEWQQVDTRVRHYAVQKRKRMGGKETLEAAG